ncbi:hypothetical protein Emag_007406 [Eimeria magna]
MLQPTTTRPTARYACLPVPEISAAFRLVEGTRLQGAATPIRFPLRPTQAFTISSNTLSPTLTLPRALTSPHPRPRPCNRPLPRNLASSAGPTATPSPHARLIANGASKTLRAQDYARRAVPRVGAPQPVSVVYPTRAATDVDRGPGTRRELEDLGSDAPSSVSLAGGECPSVAIGSRVSREARGVTRNGSDLGGNRPMSPPRVDPGALARGSRLCVRALASASTVPGHVLRTDPGLRASRQFCKRPGAVLLAGTLAFTPQSCVKRRADLSIVLDDGLACVCVCGRVCVPPCLAWCGECDFSSPSS